MNDSERTISKTKSLKLKSFHRRLLRIVKPILRINLKSRKEFHGSASGGGKGDIVTCLCYRLEAIKSVFIGDIKKTITQHFNKPQLKGKLILIGGEYFRII